MAKAKRGDESKPPEKLKTKAYLDALEKLQIELCALQDWVKTTGARVWCDYSRARDQMLAATDREEAPWCILRSDDKKRARLNGIAHILSLIPYEKIDRPKIELPKRSNKHRCDDQRILEGRRMVATPY